jgi:hypothetical protein
MTRPRAEVDPVDLEAFSAAWMLAGVVAVKQGRMVEALNHMRQFLTAKETPPGAEGFRSGV